MVELLKNAREIKALEEIGLKLSGRPEKIDAKQCPVPTLELGKGNNIERGKESFFQLFNKPIFSGKHDIPCTILYGKGADVNPMVDVF